MPTQVSGVSDHHVVRPVSASVLQSASELQTRSHPSSASARLDSKIEDLRAKRSSAVRESAIDNSKSFQQRHLPTHSSTSRVTSTCTTRSDESFNSPSTRQQKSSLPKALDRNIAARTSRSRHHNVRREHLTLNSNQTHAELDWRSSSPGGKTRLLSPSNVKNAELADSSVELNEIQQSVQRLRAQRTHVEQLRHHNDRLERLVNEQRRENEELRAKLTSLRSVEQENIGLLQSFKLLEERLRSLEHSCHEKCQELKVAHDKIASVEIECRHLEAEMQSMELEHEQRVESLKTKQTTLVDRIRQLERDQDAFIDKQQRLEQHWRDRMQHAQQETLLEQQDSRIELEQARNENKKLTSEISQLNAQVQTLLATTVRQTTMIEDCDRVLSEAKAQQKTAKASYHDQLELNGRLKEQIQHLELQLSALQIGSENDKVSFEKRVFELESKLMKRKDRMEVLQDAVHERDKQLQALQREAAAQHRNWEHIDEVNDDLKRREKTLLSEISELQIALGDAMDEKKILAEQVLSLQDQLEIERKDRSRWATARLKLLAEFCDEENKLSSALRFGGAAPVAASSSVDTRWSRDDLDAIDGLQELDGGDDEYDDERRQGSIVFG